MTVHTFKTQSMMTGSEKADGYSRDAFIGLTENEKETVFQILESELPFSVEWLFLGDATRAYEEVAERTEQQIRHDGYKHVYLLQKYLTRHSDDLTYHRRIEGYPHCADYIKPLVIDAIGRTLANKAAIEFFKKDHSD